MNLLDRAIAALAPTVAVKRAAARAALAMHYDGASRSHRTSFRPIGGTSANTEIAMSLPRLRDVCRDFGRNNPIATNIHRAIPSNVVGAGIIPSVKAKNKGQKATVQSLIEDHLDTPAIDFDGRHNLYGLQNLAMRSVVESGEVLIVRYVPPSRLRLPVPLQVRVLEADYLDFTRHGKMPNGNVCFQGIEFDADGRRVAYWLYDEHPGGGLTWQMPVSKRVDASDVKHIFRVDRPGQQRGVPWGAAAIMTMWDLANYREAELMRQKIAACFAVFFTGPDSGGLAAGAAKTNAGTPIARLEPGMIQALPTGSEVTTATPPMMQGFRDFNTIYDRQVCLAYGVPYEVGTGDNSQVSFISGRLGRITFNIDIDQWRWHMLIPHMCCGIGDWFMQAAVIARGPMSSRPKLTWTPPRREMVSPKDEIGPMRDAVRAGFIPRSEQVRSLGFDPEQVEQEFAEENDRADAAKLRFDSDGRFPLATHGTENVAPADDAGGNDNPDPPKPEDDSSETPPTDKPVTTYLPRRNR
jgi:lambda family phage portal protein